MKLWIKILFTAIIILALILSAAHFYLLFQGRSLITKQLERLTHKKVSIGHFDILLPLNLELRNVEIEGLAKIGSVYISPSIPALLMGVIALNRVSIIGPEITYQRVESPTNESSQTISSTSLAPPQKKKPPLRLIFKNLKIKNGRINFIDNTVGSAGIKITAKEINFNLTNLYVFPHSVITNFELSGKIPWQQGQKEGKIEVEGWLNFFKKDMQASLKIEDIDGIYLYPYYSNWVDLEKARIESARLTFTSNIHGLNNDVTADCHLELTDIVRKPRPPEEGEEKASRIADAVLDIFRALNQGKIVLDFTIRTKMDRPQFGFSNIKMAFENKLAQARASNGFKIQDVLALPGNLLQGTVKSATDLSKAVIEGTFSVGKELKKAVEDTFRKERKER